MFGLNSHEPLRRLQHQGPQGDFCSLPRELVSEETPCILPSSENSGTIYLPLNFVSLPTVEEGHVTLRQQIAKRHHKAIRRNLSKTKELVLFVGGLRCNLSASQYISYATECAKTENKSSIGPVFPSLGCFFVTFFSGTSAALARKCFRFTRFHGRIPDLLFLPYISVPRNAEEYTYDPLLVFINCKSGGGQGSQLHEMMLGTLNPSQIFLIDRNGALPGLFAFRKLARFRILVCGGDGTVGWVLSHLDKAQRHLRCTDPPMAVLPVGTGNDLARVLGYGPGYTGESVDGILAQIQDSEPVQLDRWNVMFDSKSDDKLLSPDPLLLSDAVSFREDAVDGVRKPLSPINIVMSMGGMGSEPKDFSDHTGGIRNLASTTIPVDVSNASDNPPPGGAKTNDIKILNPHCDINDVSQRFGEQFVGDTNAHKLTDNSAETVTSTDALMDDMTTGATVEDSSSADINVPGSNKTYETTPDNLAADETLTDKKSSNEAMTHNLAGVEKATNIFGDYETDPNSLAVVETAPDKLSNVKGAGDNSADDKKACDSFSNDQETLGGLIENEAPPEEFNADEVKFDGLALNDITSNDLTGDEMASDNLTSIESASSGEFSTKLLRQRSGSSTKHRFVQILSASDLDFGPFVGFEEKKATENGESGEHLKRKASLLKLKDTDETKASETDNHSLSLDNQSGSSTNSDNPADVEDEDSFPQSSNIKRKPPRPTNLIRATSETIAKSGHKAVAFNKKLSLPISPSSYASKSGSSSVDDVKMVVMNNYFGVGIGAELMLAFHLAREENPEKCTSRLRNKALVFKAGLKKMTSRSVNLNNVIDLEVNNKAVTLPSIRGLIFLNIASWGAGAKPWGSGVSKRFEPPSFGDGMLEVLGVGGVAHMSQIYSGLRTATRIAQGEYVKMTLKAEVAVQIDGEPWMQPPGKIVITVSPHQAMMLRKTKKKSK